MCNQKFRILADEVARAVEEAGNKAFVHHPPVISDGVFWHALHLRSGLHYISIDLGERETNQDQIFQEAAFE